MLGHVRTVDHDRTNANAQRKERMAHGGQQAVEDFFRVEVEHEMHALHEMPGGHAVTQQHDNHHKQQRHHDAQAAAFKPGDHAFEKRSHTAEQQH